MRITENKLRSVIRSVIRESMYEMSGEEMEMIDRMGSRPEAYAGMGGAPSSDLNNRYLIAIANVCMDMRSHDIDRMCKKIVECGVQHNIDMQFHCDELCKAIETRNIRGIRECLHYICENSECCEICIKCCAGMPV